MKYYITFGDTERIYDVSNPYQGCMRMLRYVLTNDKYTDKYTDILPLAFRVSQIGFTLHNEDEVVPTENIVRLQLLNNEYKY